MERIPKGVFTMINAEQDFDSDRLRHLEGFDASDALRDKWVMSDYEKILTQRQKRIMAIAQKTKTKPREITRMERIILLAEVKKMRDTYRKRVEEIGKKFGDSYRTVR